jgi:hypothetical protein
MESSQMQQTEYDMHVPAIHGTISSTNLHSPVEEWKSEELSIACKVREETTTSYMNLPSKGSQNSFGSVQITAGVKSQTSVEVFQVSTVQALLSSQ